jgi:hypothetical protein
LLDAAGLWGGSSGKNDPLANRGNDKRFSLEPNQVSPQKAADNEDPSAAPIRRSALEGGLMPFDMEVPVAYRSVTAGNIPTLQHGITDISTGGLVTSKGIGVVEEVEPVSVDVKHSTSIMENIDTERVPCPRLCGAVFGKGNGGLVIFNNGEAKKMWNWYQRTDTIRLSSAPGGKGDPSERMVHNTSGTGTSHQLSPQVEATAKRSKMLMSSGPRTLKELVAMVATAKEVSRNVSISNMNISDFPACFLIVSLLILSK